MKSTDFITARQHDLVVQESKDELLIYDLRINKAYCLNETSALVYRLCDGAHSIAEISRRMSKTLGAAVTEDLVWLTISELKRNDLLNESGSIRTKFENLSRREAVRRVGLVTIVALPVIVSLVAPAAAEAGSSVCNPCTNSIPLGQLCLIPTGCLTSTFFAGVTTTGCDSSCRYCTCRIPGGERSCSSTCTRTSPF